MNMHIPQSIITEAELHNLAAIPWQIVNPGSNKPLIGIFQDSLLGSFRFSRSNIQFTPLKAMGLLAMYPHIDVNELERLYKEKGHISNFDIISQITPPISLKYKTALYDEEDDPKTSNGILEIQNGKYIRGQLDKGCFESASKGILHRICNDYGNIACMEFNDNIQNIITEYMKTSSFSVGISDLIANRATNEKIMNKIQEQKMQVQTLIDKIHMGIFENNTAASNMEHFELMVSNILNKATEEAGKIGKKSLSKDNRFLMIVNSGSKGSLINISQMLSCLGQTSIDGKRIAYGFEDRTLPHFKKFDDSPFARGFIENSYISGLTAPELFFHAMAGRTGLIDTAVKSVTRDTTIIVIENGKCKYTEIGPWIDHLLENQIEKVKHYPEDRNMELLDMDGVYIPTTDKYGNVSWGEVSAITRHDPGQKLYKITTLSGRTVTVPESKSLLIWDNEKRVFEERLTEEITLNSYVPVSEYLCKPPAELDFVDMTTYLPKQEYIYGTDFHKATSMMNDAMNERNHIPNGWWNEHNGKSFTLPYSKKSSLQRTMTRSNTYNIQIGCVYPYHAKRSVAHIPDKFELNEENGIFIGLFLAEGNVNREHVYITNNNENIRNFVKSWFTKHSITFSEKERINKIGGKTTSIVGNSAVLAYFLNKFVGHGAQNKYVPNEAFVSNRSFIIGLLNGYYSGDGYVSKNSIDVGSASKRLIEGIVILCNRIGVFGKMSVSQLKQNNLGTKNIKPFYRFRFSAQWGKVFCENVNLIEENKQQKMKQMKWRNSHMNFKTQNNVVLDPIVDIMEVDVKDHPKLYDLTIPSTKNFGLANGLHVYDTSQTGYIQRRLVKGLEDLIVKYDMTVRNNKDKIIQFSYGEDNFDSTKVENQSLPIVEMSMEDIYMHYDIPGMNTTGKGSTTDMNLLQSVFSKSTITRFKKQIPQLKEKVHSYIEKLRKNQEDVIIRVFKRQKESGVKLPVAFQYIIGNIQGQLELRENTAVDITPLEAFELIETYFEKINSVYYAKTNPLFELLYFFYLNPRDLLLKRRFHQKGLILLLETIFLKYKEALVHPGEMVGVVAAQSIGEPSTQLTLNSVTFETEILVKDIDGIAHAVQIGDFIEKGIKASNKVEYMENKDTTYTELDEFYEVPCATEDGRTVWRRIEAVTKHPVINEDGTNTMLKITTEGCREITVTKAKSVLQLIDGKIQPVSGASLKVGDYLPVSRKALEYKASYRLDLKPILAPTEYIYGSEIAKAKDVVDEFHWWRKHSNKTFTLPYARSDSAYICLKKTGKRYAKDLIVFEPGYVYTKNNTICNYLIPEVIELDYDFGYLLGAYCAEGCMTKHQISIANNDKAFFDPIERICKKFNLTTKKYVHNNKGKEGWTSSDIRIYSTLMCRIIEKLCGKLSHGKFVDRSIVFSNQECIRGFLDAYISGDGCIYYDKERSINATSVSYRLLLDIQLMMKNIGVMSKIMKTKKHEGDVEFPTYITKAENVKQPYLISIRNQQCTKLAKILNLTISQKMDKILKLREHSFALEYGRKDLTIPNVVDDEITWEHRNGAMMDMEFDPIVSIEEVPNTTAYAYDLTVEETRNFDCINGVCLRDTFHGSGISSKSNVTRGVPRIEEILRLTKNPKNPSMTVYLKPYDQEKQETAINIASIMKHTKLVDVVKSIQICFDPIENSTTIEDDKPIMDEYYAFERIVQKCIKNHDDSCPIEDVETFQSVGDNNSKWIIRIEMDQDVMLENNISMDEVHFAITHSSYGANIQCVFTDYNKEKLIFRIRANSSIFAKANQKGYANPLDQTDKIYILRNFQDALLNNIVLRGISHIKNVLPRKIQNSVVKEDGKYVKKDIWVLDTTGSNMLDTLAIDYIDSRRSYSNDIKEIFDVLGIEAARQTIHNELVEVMEFSGASINYHHTSLLCDRMTCNKDMVSIFRSGLLNDNVGPIAKATFEVHTEVFLDAARHGEFDHMRGVSANIMCGQQGLYGTNAFQLLLDMKAMEGVQANKHVTRDVEHEIEMAFQKKEEIGDKCGTSIEIQNNIANIKRTTENMRECFDDKYDMGF